ncbi:MAG: DUF6526 family protein [Bacteroidota bacterium]|nr:DUF6526 family protein [Bacteroidota bacterium]
MSQQNFKNHARYEPGFHFVAFPIAILTFIGSVYHLFGAWGTDTQYAAALLVATNLALCGACFYGRLFALKAQDRVIHLEETLRAQRLTGQGLDSGLTMRQIIGLRFASDTEWPELSQRAVSQGMSEKEIKQAIQNWRADTYRV